MKSNTEVKTIGNKRLCLSERTKRELPLHLMLLPAVIIVFIFAYIPMGGIIIAFQNYTPVMGFLKSEWVGFENFKYVFQMQSFGRVFWNTFFIAFMKIVMNLVCPVFLSIMMNELKSVRMKKCVQTVVYLPHFLSWVILSGILVDILSPSEGIVNRFITALGGDPVFFLGEEKIFPYVIVITNSWKEVGWQTIIYLAAIIGIDPTLYEAATVDGASRIRQVFAITIPCIAGTIVLMMVLSLGSILNAGFDQIFNLYSPQVYSTGDIIDTMVYRLGLVDAQFGPSTAMGLFKSVISLVFVLGSYYLADKWAGYRVF